MYKISVILPTFNVEKYLKKSFDSLMSQTIGFSNLQIIFVDDCSTDNSRKVIDNYAENYTNVISIHLNENSGAAGRPRNEGIKFAFADYVLFLDPDDYLMDNACEVLYNKIIESDADIIVGGYEKGDWKATWNSILKVEESIIKNPKNNRSIVLNPPGLAAKLFKKELILKNNIRFPEKISAQDLVFITECYMNANLILTLNNFIVYCYYVRDDENDKSISNNVTKKYLLNLLTAYNLTIDLVSKHNMNSYLISIYLSRNHVSFFVNQLKKSNLSGDELESFFKSDTFLKFRNADYVLNNTNLNKFFDDLIEDYESIDLTRLIQIWKDIENQYVNSTDENRFEKEFKSNQKQVPNESEITENLEQELYDLLKKTSKLNNIIEDYNQRE